MQDPFQPNNLQDEQFEKELRIINGIATFFPAIGASKAATRFGVAAGKGGGAGEMEKMKTVRYDVC